MPEIRKMLDLSTGHLDAPSKSYLENAAGEESSFMAGQYGWLAPVIGEDLDELAAYAFDHGVPEVLHHALRRAHELDCDFVLFDADAPYDEMLPVFDEDAAPASQSAAGCSLGAGGFQGGYCYDCQ